ncbi:flagellar biosynthesis protein FliQ [Rhodovibrionaceae bacterium A322]
MNGVDALEIGRDAIWTMLKVGGPVLFIALAVGLVVSLFQALTQMQEMTLSFVPKILVIFLSLLVLMPFMISQLSAFTLRLMDRIIAMG